MNILTLNTSLTSHATDATDALIVNLFEGQHEPQGATGAVDKALNGAIGELITNGDFSGKLNTTAVLYPRGAIPAQRVIVVGLGKAESFTADKARQASASATRKAQALNAKHIASVAHGAGAGGLETTLAAQAVVEGAVLSQYTYKPKKGETPIESLTLLELDANKMEAITNGAQAGSLIAESVNFTRTLANQPPNICTPAYMAEQAQAMAQEVGLTCKILSTAQMTELGMGALLAVGYASALQPQFIILEHRPAGSEDTAPVVLVGKGITFDSGGLSIKTPADMPEMKFDMAGGAAVIGALRAVALLKLPRPVIGLIPVTENVIGARGFRPADVLTASNGKTIEIISTDAEGRLILADALVYANRYHPAAVVDIATLTGACMIALGRAAAGLFATDEALANQLLAAADRSQERIWRLPLYDEYRDLLKSDVADMKNSAGDRYGGVGVSAAFLREFAEGYPWAHLDIAAMSHTKGAHALGPQGATGFGVRLFVEWVRESRD